MTPLYLGSSQRRLFGIYEPPAVKADRVRAVVLCNPWGAEYIYAHRSLRQLATTLSMCGFHTLRFDFFGTGDSAGEMADGDLAGWESDVESAMEGISDIVGTARVSLIGLRLGATIAAKVAARHAGEIDSLVLWDPIISGDVYLRSLQTTSLPTRKGEEDAWEIEGFPMSLRMMHELKAIDLRDLIAEPSGRSLMLITEESRSSNIPRAATLADDSRVMEIEFLGAPCPWVDSGTTTGAVPVQVVKRIAEWLS